jgi:hypothetical protein
MGKAIRKRRSEDVKGLVLEGKGITPVASGKSDSAIVFFLMRGVITTWELLIERTG